MSKFEINPPADMAELYKWVDNLIHHGSRSDLEQIANMFRPRSTRPSVQATEPLEEILKPEVKLQIAGSDKRWQLGMAPGSSVNLREASAPRILIDETVLLAFSCQVALMKVDEIGAALQVIASEDRSTLRIIASSVYHDQVVSRDRVSGSGNLLPELPLLALQRNRPIEELRNELHGDFHSHVSFPVVPSDIDRSTLFLRASCLGDWSNPDPNPPLWWISVIGNRLGEFRVHFLDLSRRLYFDDIPWELGERLPSDKDRVDWVRTMLPAVYDDVKSKVKFPAAPEATAESARPSAESRIVPQERWDNWGKTEPPKPAREVNPPISAHTGESQEDAPASVGEGSTTGVSVKEDSSDAGPPASLKPAKKGTRRAKALGLAAVACLLLATVVLELLNKEQSDIKHVALLEVSQPPVLEVRTPVLPPSTEEGKQTPAIVAVASADPAQFPSVNEALAKAPAVETPPAAGLNPEGVAPKPKEPEKDATPAVPPPADSNLTTPVKLAERFKGVTRPERIWPEYARFSKVPTSMLKQFGGMTTEEFYAWRKEHPKEMRRVPLVVHEAFDEGDDARKADLHCRVCGLAEPQPFCEQYVDNRHLQEVCDVGAKYLGKKEKPLRKVLETRLEEKAKARK